MNKVKSKGKRGIWMSCLLLCIPIISYIAFSLAVPQLVSATTITVNTTDDELNADGDCSLREAIRSANRDAAVHACTAGNGADEIVFDSSVIPGTFTLTIPGRNEDAAEMGDLDITDDLTITGAGAASTIIDGNQLDRVFHAIGPIAVDLKGLTIRGGRVGEAFFGSGIFNDGGTLEVLNSTIADNWTGIRTQLGSTSIAHSSLTHNDIAIFQDGGNLNIKESTIKLNDVSGVMIGDFTQFVATFEITNSTIAYNGSLVNTASGGGVLLDSIFGRTEGTITNTTIAQNVASERGGGIRIQSTALGRVILKITNTILAENEADVGPDCYGELTSLGNNIIGDPTGCNIILLPNSDKTGDPGFVDNDSNGEPDFIDDGRPGRGHFPLQSNSQAIDAGNNDVCIGELSFGQLGFPRVDGPDTNDTITCDIGAVEYQIPNTYRFVVMADSRDDPKYKDRTDNPTDGVGVNEVDFERVMDSIGRLSPKPSFILFGGDLADGKHLTTREKKDGPSMVAEFEGWQDVIRPHYPVSNVHPVFGGHERNTLDTSPGSLYPHVWSAFSRTFDPVDDGPLENCEYFPGGSYGHTVYVCDYQNARFFVLNNDVVNKFCKVPKPNPNPPPNPSCDNWDHEWGEGETGLDQVAWLAGKLGVKPLNFLIYHEPAFGTSRFLDAGTRDGFIETLGDPADNVTMIFSGHEHQYTRRLIHVGLTDCDPACDFDASFYELKTGSAGAPLNYDYNYLDNGLRNIVVGPVFKYHYAVVDVAGSNVFVKVYGVNQDPANPILIDSFSVPARTAPTLPIEPRMRNQAEMAEGERWRFWQGKEDAWRYFPGWGEPDGPNDPQLFWTTLNFDDSKWLIGPTGLGYGDEDDSTVLFDMQNNYLSLYARHTFTVDDPGAIARLTLKMDYDDSFVAYLNGQEVARANINGTPPSYNKPANGDREAEVYHGGDPAEFDINTDRLQAGTNVLAIQGHNKAIDSSDFSLMPWLRVQSIVKFEDIPPGFWAEDHIYAIFNEGITKGCSQNPLLYCPKKDVTRDQMAAFIVRAVEGEPPDDYCATSSPFSDVSPASLFCKYIKRLSELGITKGCGGNNYCPKTTVKRDQMAAFLVRAVEGEPDANYCDTGSPFSDVSSSSVFCKYIKRLSELEITKGCGGSNYCPKTTVKRDQMAVFLGRAFLGMN